MSMEKLKERLHELHEMGTLVNVEDAVQDNEDVC